MAQFDQHSVVMADSQAPQVMGSIESPVIVDDTHGLTFATGAAGGEIFLGAVGAGGFRYEGGSGRDVLHLAGDIDVSHTAQASFAGVDVLDVNGHVLTVRQGAFDSYNFDVVGAAPADGAPAGGLAIVLSGRDLDLSNLTMDAETRPSLTLIQDESMDFRAGGATITLNDSVDETIHVKDLFKFSKVITLKNFQGDGGDRLLFNGDAPTDLIAAADGSEIFTNGAAEIREFATLEERLDALARLVTQNGSAGSYAVYMDGTDTYIIALADGAENAQVVRLLGADYDLPAIQQGIGALQPAPEPGPEPSPAPDQDSFWDGFWDNGGAAGGGSSTPPTPPEPTSFDIDPIPDDGKDGLSRPDDDRNLTVTVGADENTGLSVGDRGDLDIELGDGNNTVTLEGGIGENAAVDITTGSGDDDVEIKGDIGSGAVVNANLGGGENSLKVDGDLGDNATLDVTTTGGGNSTVEVGDLGEGSTVKASLGSGRNELKVGDLNGDNSSLQVDSTATGNDDDINFIDIGNVNRGSVLFAKGGNGKDYMTIQSMQQNSAIGQLETLDDTDWIILGTSGGDTTNVEGVTASGRGGDDTLVLKGTAASQGVGANGRGLAFDGGADNDTLQLADGCTVDGILQLFGDTGDDIFQLGGSAPTKHGEAPTSGDITITDRARLTIYGGTGDKLSGGGTPPGTGLSTPHADAGNNDTLLVKSNVDASEAATFKVHGIEVVDVTDGKLIAKGETFNDNEANITLKGDGLTIKMTGTDRTADLSKFTAGTDDAEILIDATGITHTGTAGVNTAITLSDKNAGIKETVRVDSSNTSSGYMDTTTIASFVAGEDNIQIVKNGATITAWSLTAIEDKTNSGKAAKDCYSDLVSSRNTGTDDGTYTMYAFTHTGKTYVAICMSKYNGGWSGGNDFGLILEGTGYTGDQLKDGISFVSTPATTTFSLFSLGPDPDDPGADAGDAGASMLMARAMVAAPMAMLLDDEGLTFGAAFEDGAAPAEEIVNLMAEIVEAVEAVAESAEAGDPDGLVGTAAGTADDLPAALDAFIEAIVSATVEQAAGALAEIVESAPVDDAPAAPAEDITYEPAADEPVFFEASAPEPAPAVVDDVVYDAPADSGMDFQMDEAVLSGIDVLPDMTDLGA